jgi:taurine dioxygenase
MSTQVANGIRSENGLEQLVVKPSGASLGAQLEGLDLSVPLGEATVERVRKALLDHSVVYFRGQTLTGTQQVDFTRHFGKPEEHVRGTDGSRVPGIFVVSNVVENGKPIGALGSREVGFHSDLAYMARPGTLSALYALEVPPQGGTTTWCSGYAAYDALDAKMKARLDGLRATHRHVTEANNPPDVVDHPMVCTHPETGRKTLYVTPLFTRAVVGMAEPESSALLKTLCEHLLQPRFSWSHRWSVGDIVMWDNRCTMHRRDPFPDEHRRVMHRTQVYNDAVPLP